jgi:hypothetical protein
LVFDIGAQTSHRRFVAGQHDDADLHDLGLAALVLDVEIHPATCMLRDELR